MAKLANKSCYPTVYEFEKLDDYRSEIHTSEGLTFRERLIIALASNPSLTYKLAENGKPVQFHLNAVLIVKQANEIIKQLEEENEL